MEGGGGKGVLCSNGLRTLDLYEAEKIRHLLLSPAFHDVDAYLEQYGVDLSAYSSDSKFDPSDLNDAWKRKYILDFIKRWIEPKFVDIPSGDHLPATPDATLPTIPSGCSFVQIAIYSDDGKIYRDVSFWNQLDARNQAALILHEFGYHFARARGALNSDKIRYLIGLTFAQKLPESVLKPIWNARQVLWCGTGEPEMIGAPFDPNGYELFGVDESRDGVQGLGMETRRAATSIRFSQVQYLDKIAAIVVAQVRRLNGDYHLSLEQAEAVTAFLALSKEESRFFIILVEV
jgi:hypothetical protein